MPGIAITRSSSYPDRETAQWCTQEMLDLHAETVRRWLADEARERLVLEGFWASRPVGKVALQAMVFVGRDPVSVHGTRMILRRAPETELGFLVHGTFPILL